MKAKLLAAALVIALLLPAVSARANDPGVTTIIAPTLCSSASGQAVHCVYGEVAYNGRLGPVDGTSFHIHIIIPRAMAFPKMAYVVLPVSDWDILAPPVKCIYTEQKLSPTAFAIIGTGCTFTPFGIDYTMIGT